MLTFVPLAALNILYHPSRLKDVPFATKSVSISIQMANLGRL
jgi:hypothetical protein